MRIRIAESRGKKIPRDPALLRAYWAAYWAAYWDTVSSRAQREWTARYGKPFRFAEFAPQIRDVISQYHIAARYNPFRLTADGFWPFVLGPLRVILSFVVRGRATSAVAQRLGLVAAAALAISLVAFLGWLGPRIALAGILPPVGAAVFPLLFVGALALGLYLWSPRQIGRLRDAAP